MKATVLKLRIIFFLVKCIKKLYFIMENVVIEKIDKRELQTCDIICHHKKHIPFTLVIEFVD